MHLGLVLAGVSPDKAEHYYVDRYYLCQFHGNIFQMNDGYFRLEPYIESALAFAAGTPLHLVFIRLHNNHSKTYLQEKDSYSY